MTMPVISDPAATPAPQTVSPPASEPPQTPSPTENLPAYERRFTAEDVERARQQEKDKLYSRYNDLQERIKVFEEERSARLKSEEDARKAAEEADRQRREAEETLAERIARQQAEFEQRIEQERQEREALAATLEKERQFAALQAYRQEAISKAQDQIVPELLDLVSGQTPEEIDASIAGLVQRSQSILENATAVLQQQRTQAPGARVTNPPIGALEIQTGQRTLSAADIAAMPMSEYAKYRASLGVTGGSNNRGLFDR